MYCTRQTFDRDLNILLNDVDIQTDKDISLTHITPQLFCRQSLFFDSRASFDSVAHLYLFNLPLLTPYFTFNLFSCGSFVILFKILLFVFHASTIAFLTMFVARVGQGQVPGPELYKSYSKMVLL